MNRDHSEDLDDDTSEPTISERIIARYPAHNWNVIDDDTLRLEAGDAYIEVGAYVADGEDDAEEIRADLEISHPRGSDLTMDDVALDDLPEAIGQGLVALHALDLSTTGEPQSVDYDTVPQWAVEAFVEQADEVSYGMDDLSYLKTYDADRYARRHVLAERRHQREAWGVGGTYHDGGSKPELAAAAWWLTLPIEAGAAATDFVPAWAITVKNQIAEKWPDPESAHEMCCIKAAALLLAEIARCRRARMKKEAADRAATPAEEKAQP